MSKFFDDTMQGLLESVAIKNEKEKETVKQEWIELGYSETDAEELSKLGQICMVKLADSSSTTNSLNCQEIKDIIFNKFNKCKHENVKLYFGDEIKNLLKLKENLK